jgi:hypothetical protein
MLEDMLRHYVSAAQTDWCSWLPLIEFAINNYTHDSTKFSPFELNYGRKPLTPLDVVLLPKSVVKEPVDSAAVTKFTSELQQKIKLAKEYLQAAQQRQKAYADSKRTDTSFTVGQQVLIKTTNFNFKGNLTRKLLPRFMGPFVITALISPVAVQVKLPPSVPIHNVFHISLVKPYRLDGRTQPPPAPLLVDGELEFEVEQILQHREVKRGKQIKIQYLVKWLGYPPEHNTWEPLAYITHADDEVAA